MRCTSGTSSRPKLRAVASFRRSLAAYAQRASGRAEPSENNAPMVEIFGGLFALMLVLFLMVNLLSDAAVRERLDQTSENGLYRINWGQSGSGFVVITFPDSLRIVENNTTVPLSRICAPGSPFIDYARRIYNTPKQQIVFTILERSVPAMRIARDCIAEVMGPRPLSIGWIIADREMLKSVSLDDMPPYIEKAASP